MIAEAVANEPKDKFNTGSTSLEWFSRRIKNQRIANRTVNIRPTYPFMLFSKPTCRAQRHIAPVEVLSGSLTWFEDEKAFKHEGVMYE